MRLIDAEPAMSIPALPKEYRNYQTGNLDDAYEQGWEDALENLKNAPTVDAVSVVRCKDCKHRTESGNCGHPRHHGILPSAYPYDFCSYGERKEREDGRNNQV